MKKLISALLCVVMMLSMSIPVSADDISKSDAKTAITQWIKKAKKYARADDFTLYSSLFESGSFVNKEEFAFLKDYVCTNKYKCTYNIASINDDKVVADIFYYRNIQSNGLTQSLCDSDVYMFRINGTRAIRVDTEWDEPDPTEYKTDAYWIKYNKTYLQGVNCGIKRIKFEDGTLTVTMIIENGTAKDVTDLLLFNKSGFSYIIVDRYKRVQIAFPNRIIDEIYDTTFKKDSVTEFTFMVQVPEIELDLTYCDWCFYLSYS